MKILSHRGLWRSPSQKNTFGSFQETVKLGFGTETDVRDQFGTLVVSHDPPVEDCVSWEALLDHFEDTGLDLAVNVKSDGLANLLKAAFANRKINWFAFDMSGPEMWRYCDALLPYYTRQSDIEPEPILYDNAVGVWLDAFKDAWFDNGVIERHVEQGKAVCVVSPELHGREHKELWRQLKQLSGLPNLSICTDLPEYAEKYFQND